MKRKKDKKKSKSGNSLFGKSNTGYNKTCPLSGKNAPEINYKNLMKAGALRRYYLTVVHS